MSFGDISDPSLRFAWEDWDDVSGETFPDLHIQDRINAPTEIDTFIILEGRYLYDCIRTQHESLEHINSIPEVNLHLFKTKGKSNYICIIKDYNLVQSSEILEKLKDYITNSHDVVALIIKPLVEYQVAHLVTKDYVLRSLLTSNRISRDINVDVSSLEQPNIIAGVTAGALCFREAIDKPAITFVCYTDHPGEQEVHEIQNLFQVLHITPTMNNIKRNSLLNSNLYI